jgi:hypothetical protein
MRLSRTIALKRASALVVCLALALSLGSWLVFAPNPAAADDGAQPLGAQKVVVFEDLTIGPDEVWDNVVVVGGDVVVQGTVERVLVVVGGNLTVGPRAVIGRGVGPEDAAVVSVFGDVNVEAGGAVFGRTVDVAGNVSDAAQTALGDSVLRTWRVGSIVNWAWSTVVLLVAAAIAAAVAPRQLAIVRERVRNHLFSSLGWGALGAFVLVPIVTVLLIVTIVGVIVAVPWLAVCLPVMSLFGLAAVGATIGRLILGTRSDERGNLIAASVLGLVIVSVVRWIPVAGAVIFGLLWLVGFGATYVAIWAWLRSRHRPEAADRGASQ